MILPNSNLSFSMVCRALGTYTSDLGRLCLSPNININSKHKPISYPKTSGLAEIDWKTANYGFQANSATSWLFTTQFETLLNQAKEENHWYYKKPQGGSNSPYRLGDFRGLNTDAIPFWQSSLPTTGLTTYPYLFVGAEVYPSADILPEDFTNITDASEWRYIGIYRLRNSALNTYDGDNQPLMDSGEYQDGGISIPIGQYATPGVYECCLAIAKYDNLTGNIIDALLVPNSYREITYNPSYSPFAFGISYDNDPLFASTSSGDYCNSFTYRFEVVNAQTGITNFNLTIYVKDSTSTIATSNYTASNLSDGIITGTCTGTFYKGDDQELNNAYVYAQFSYTYRGQNFIRYFDFDAEGVSSTEQHMYGKEFFEIYCIAQN